MGTVEAFLALIDGLATQVEKHGFLLIAVLVLGVAVYYLFTRLNVRSESADAERQRFASGQSDLLVKTLDRIMQDSRENQAAMLEFLRNEQVEHQKAQTDGEKIRDNLRTQIPGVLKIQRVMRALLDTTKADRAYMFLYHNGGMAAVGLPYMAQTCLVEEVRVGVSQGLVTRGRRFPASGLPNINRAVLEGDVFISSSVHDLPSPELYLLRDTDTKGIIISGMYESEFPVGFVGLEFVLSEMPTETTPLVKAVRSAADVCEGVYAAMRDKDLKALVGN